METTKQKIGDRLIKKVLFTSIIASLLYSNWLLGFILNPRVISGGIASELAVADQPNHRLFIGADVLSAMAIFLTVVFMYRYLKAKNKTSSGFNKILIGYCVFGLFTALTAFRPLVCAASIGQCSTEPTFRYFFHFSLGIIAASGLLVAIISTLSLRTHNILAITLFKSLAAGWLSCGVLSLVIPSSTVIPSHVFQKIYLILGAVLIVLIPYLVVHAENSRQ